MTTNVFSSSLLHTLTLRWETVDPPPGDASVDVAKGRCGYTLVFHDERGLDLHHHLGSHQLLHDGQGKLKACAWASAGD